MAQGFHLLTLLFTLILGLQPGKAPVSSDWHKRYGQPEAERYALSDGFVLTVSYSATGQTCKASIESAKAQSRAVFEGALNEIVPAAERGKELRSIDLSNLVGFTQYELVTVSLYPVSRESRKNRNRLRRVTSRCFVCNNTRGKTLRMLLGGFRRTMKTPT